MDHGQPTRDQDQPQAPTMCSAGEWQRDGRGLWAERRCQYYAGHGKPHAFGQWRYNVQPPQSPQAPKGCECRSPEHLPECHRHLYVAGCVCPKCQPPQEPPECDECVAKQFRIDALQSSIDGCAQRVAELARRLQHPEALEEIAQSLFSELCEGNGTHSEALDRALILKHLRRAAALQPPQSPQAPALRTACCGVRTTADQRYCPKCGWEFRALPQAPTLRALIEQWRKEADVCEQRKREAADARFESGENINRAKMLAYRDCADQLEAALLLLSPTRQEQ